MRLTSRRRRGNGKVPALLGLVAALLVAVGYLLATRPQKMELDPNVRVGRLTRSPEEVRAELEAQVDESMISFSINATPAFENGREPGNLMIENPAGNRNRFTVEIRLKEDGRTVYQSGYIDPGQYIERAPLDEALPAGEYPAVAYFTAYSLRDGGYIGQVGGELSLHVLE